MASLIQCKCGRCFTVEQVLVSTKPKCSCAEDLILPSLVKLHRASGKPLSTTVFRAPPERAARTPEPQEKMARDPGFRFEGCALIVYADVELPNLCMKSGERVPSSEMRKSKVSSFAPPPIWLVILAVLGVPVFWYRFLFGRKRTYQICYGHSISHRRRSRRRLIVALCVITFAVVSLIIRPHYFLSDFSSKLSLVCFVLVLYVGLFLLWLFSRSGITSVSFHPDGLRITGFKRGFKEAFEMKE